MARFRKGCLAFAICLWGMPASLYGSPEEVLLERLSTKLISSFANGQPWVPGSEMLLLSSPGLPLNPSILADAPGLSRLLDQIPVVSMWFHPSGARISTIYGQILQFAQASSFVNMPDRDKYNAAMEFLYDRTRPGVLTPRFAQYRQAQAKRLKAQTDLDFARDQLSIAEAENRASDARVPVRLIQAVTEAEARLAGLKVHGAEIEQALKTIADFNQARAGAWMENLRDAFNAERGGGEEVGDWPPPWEAVPPLGNWLQPEGWQAISFKQGEHPLPLQAVPGSATGPDKPPVALAPDWLASLSLSVETKRVRIIRPWLAPALLTKRNWRLAPECGFPAVSTGNLADTQPGMMPLLVTGILLGRNLVIKGNWKQNGKTPAVGGKPLSELGPFNLLGATTRAGGPHAQAGAAPSGELSITAEGTQIIGFFCEVLPKCPDPDSTFR